MLGGASAANAVVEAEVGAHAEVRDRLAATSLCRCLRRRAVCAVQQRRTLVHYLAQRKHFLWVKLGGDSLSVTRRAQLEVKSG